MLLLARRSQQVFKPLLLLLLLLLMLFKLASSSSTGDKSAKKSKSSESLWSSQLDLTNEFVTTGTSLSQRNKSDDLGYSSVSFLQQEPSTSVLDSAATATTTTTTATTKKTKTTTTVASTRTSNRIQFQLDFTTFHRRWTRSSEASNPSKTAVSTVSSQVMNVTRRVRRDDQSPCFKFEEGDPVKQEFYSPNYPEPYPKDISCFKVLEADPGMVLKVEFRDSFELEDQEKCSYDFLEVRDGKYGYSRLIGRYCRAFPFPEITSSSRYLWLYFHSDNSIQGSGFRAVWSQIPRPPVKTPETEECMLTVSDELERLINTTEIEDKKKTAADQGTELDCIWNITVPEGYKIQISFPDFHLDKPNECDINYVQVYDKEPTMINNPSLINNFCGSIAELITSKGNEAYLRFFVTKAAMNSSFKAIMTAVREKESKDKGCNDDEFDCQDSCIWGKLKCNERANCRYRFDEDADVCNVEKSGLNMQSEHVIIILVVFTLLMSGLCFTFIYNCFKKLIRDHKIIKEHIRQSRENRLDEIGRKQTPCSMIEACTEIGIGDHRHSSESPSLEVMTNPKELVSPVTIIDRDYMRERSLRLSVDLNDIHQSNNVSNTTQERLKEFSEERETRDMECQTRESIFDTGLILKPSGHPAFTTFGVGFQTPESSRKQSFEYHPNHHYHHHAHPHHHPTPYTYHHHHHHTHQQVKESTVSPPSEKIEQSPVSRRCSVCHPSSTEPSSHLCWRHSSTPILPAPHGWSLHESMYNPDDLPNLQQICDTSPTRIPEIDLSEPSHLISGKPSPHFPIRQRTIGSGENYGFIYGSEDKELSEHTGSSGSSSQKSGLAKPVKCPQVMDSRFKTEAVIEVDQKRPFSIESTKSAPDVIATH